MQANMTMQMRTVSLLVWSRDCRIEPVAPAPERTAARPWSPPANLDRLVNREWLLKNVTVDSQRVIMHVDATQTLQFGSDGRVIGYGGVNRFAGHLQVLAGRRAELSGAGAGHHAHGGAARDHGQGARCI